MKNDAIAFLKQVLSIPSVNGEKGEETLARFLQQYLVDCGLEADVLPVEKGRANIRCTAKGRTEEAVIWNGHLDTVPYGKLEEWDSDPSLPREQDGRIYARGASDMKSGLAAMVYILGRMKEKGRIPEKTLYFYGTCDEEKSGLGAKQLQPILPPTPSLLLIGEPTGLRPGVAQKGCIWLQFTIQGKTSHGAYPEEGINAVEQGFEIARKLKQRVEKEVHPLLGKATAQITMVKGGIVPNMTPDFAQFMMDIRIIPGMNAKQVMGWAEESAEETIRKTRKKCKVEMELQNNRQPIEVKKDNNWLQRIEKELRARGLPMESLGINYFTDASVFKEVLSDVPAILLGPGEPNMAHKPNEYVDIKKYLQYIDVLRFLFYPECGKL